MAVINDFEEGIKGVRCVSPTLHRDGRGYFVETFRPEWFPEVNWQQIQQNTSFSIKDVLRGLHYHLRQVDYWRVFEGKILVGLYDLRQNSSTFGRSMMLEMNAMNKKRDPGIGLFIPSGVAHGFLVLSEVAFLNYLTNQYYNPDDEHGLRWNDPALRLDWRIKCPILSEKDAKNPFLKDIPKEELPV